ncbi:hypothetical protein [Eikenella corrodens]|uniref:Uncharacterized protein n=1 Tax=Eikenella corrodens TaxID=539 RepID=A0A3S9SI59_EIKCO|nr:hypothetical protein [Eikenella corrodens]AZR59180.1 hypothetical protein ELB75_03530 [Eikenella corrodens]AZR59203.1 hypothetical protein ELB75_03670 [Eikenella corrodens]
MHGQTVYQRPPPSRVPAYCHFEGDTVYIRWDENGDVVFLPSEPIGRDVMPLPANWREAA